jgi:hypothetical protein
MFRYNPENNVEVLTQILFDIGGDRVIGADDDPDLAMIIERGRLFDIPARMTNRGLPVENHPFERQLLLRCHGNSSILWEKDPDTYSICTGYAQDDGWWRSHSWCLDKKLNIIAETMMLRDNYFGFVLDDEQAQRFYDANVGPWLNYFDTSGDAIDWIDWDSGYS